MSHEVPKRISFFMWLASRSYLPRWAVLLLDLLITLIAFVMSFQIGNQLLSYHAESLLFPIWVKTLIVITTQAILFCALRTYAGILRFSTFVDATKCSLAVFCTSLLLIVSNLLVQAITGKALLINTMMVLYFFIATVLLIAWRVVVKLSFEYISHHRGGMHNVMIYGTKSAGLAIGKMLKGDMDSQYNLVGFIDDPGADKSHQLLGFKIYTKDENLITRMQLKDVHDVIVSPLKMKSINPATDLNIFLDNSIRILTTPEFTNYASDEEMSSMERIGKIEAIRVEDLLERPSIHIDTDHVSEILNNQVVLITGAAGSIGSEIVRQVCTYKPQLIVLFEIAESPLHDLSMDLRSAYPHQQFVHIIGDVRDRSTVERAMEEYHPNVVFHAAAYKHVPLMEEFPQQAVLANVLGTKNVADMAVQYGVQRFVMISTDKAVNPTNVMGCSKRIAEIYVQALGKKNGNTRFITTRFGNVLGSNGSVVPYFKKQIAAGGPVTVTHPDIIRYFMSIPEASCLVLEAATLGKGGEIFVFDMGRPVKIADLAKNMIRLAGFIPGQDIKIEYTGLRPGEKLYEELLNRKEKTLPTPNEKIRIAKVRENDYDTVSLKIDELIEEARHGRIYPTVKRMKELVPEYKSKNSIFEDLDK